MPAMNYKCILAGQNIQQGTSAKTGEEPVLKQLRRRNGTILDTLRRGDDRMAMALQWTL